MREEEEELVVREPGVDPTRVRRQRGWDEVTTLSDKWFKDFPKRTKAYMKVSLNSKVHICSLSKIIADLIFWYIFYFPYIHKKQKINLECFGIF